MTVDPEELGNFEGRPIIATRMTVTNTGEGLTDAMTIDPMVLHHGDEVFLLMKGVVSDIRMPEVKGTEAVARHHVIRAVEATIVDEVLAEPVLAVQRQRLRDAIEEASGQDSFLGGEET